VEVIEKQVGLTGQSLPFNTRKSIGENLSSAHIYIFVFNSSANPLKGLVEESPEDKISQEDALYSWDLGCLYAFNLHI
jgi:hypothetical protein